MNSTSIGSVIECGSSSAPATSRPHNYTSLRNYIYEGSSSSSVSHTVPFDHTMKKHYPSSGSMVVSKRSYKLSRNANEEKPSEGREKFRRNGRGDSETVDCSTQKKVITLENVDSNASSLPFKGSGDVLNDQMQTKLGIGHCPSPQTHSTEAKRSFTNTEASECTSTLGKKSGEIEEITETLETNSYRQSDGGNSDLSDESGFRSAANKPHKANDTRWEAIQAVKTRNNRSLELKNFRLFKKLGAGDIGSVHLAELIGTKTCFAIKAMDKEALVSRKKLLRAQTEREILQCLDHPFLPTLYAHFETEKFSFLAMEFCPGGDLHALRQKQPGKYFPEHAARFYLAEVLLALEYLHMLGIIYRDLKPENVLVREDGHIMLSDFDLSLRCAVSPTLVRSSNTTNSESKSLGPYCVQPNCIEPPSCAIQPACFGPRILRKSKKDKKSEARNQVNPLPELMAEPTNARSMSFVGTHEYLAPEIVKGEGHGSAVDWWTLGIFLYELLFGRTPFKGAGNRATLFNVVGQPLRFPDSPTVSFAARDLIRGLLVKEPQHRLGFRRGATEIKQHPFFQSVNWALVRCASPPEIPPVFSMHDDHEPPMGQPMGQGHVVAGPRGIDLKPTGNYYEIDFF